MQLEDRFEHLSRKFAREVIAEIKEVILQSLDQRNLTERLRLRMHRLSSPSPSDFRGRDRPHITSQHGGAADFLAKRRLRRRLQDAQRADVDAGQRGQRVRTALEALRAKHGSNLKRSSLAEKRSAATAPLKVTFNKKKKEVK